MKIFSIVLLSCLLVSCSNKTGMGFEKGSEVSITLFDPLIFPNGKGLDQFEHLYIHKVTSDMVIVKTEKGNRIQIPIEKISSIDDGLGGHIEFARNPEETLDATKPVEEKQQEIKEEVKAQETVVESTPEADGVNVEELEEHESIWYLKDSGTPYTGKAFDLLENGKKVGERTFKDGKPDGIWTTLYENGQKEGEVNWKDGKLDGLWVIWHENGQKMFERNHKDDEEVEGSEKYWNSKGEPVDTYEESIAE